MVTLRAQENNSKIMVAATDLLFNGGFCQALSAELREKHPELPWRQVIAMRNVIAHEYGNLDFDIVWNVVKGPEFTAFSEHIKKILDD